MEPKRYQWVGLLAGVPLFSGAWLSAFYNNLWWGIVGVLIAGWGLWVANRVERRSYDGTQMTRGFVAGVLAALVARALGALTTAIAGATQSVPWQQLDDAFRVVLGGNWWATLLLVLVTGVIGLVIAVAEPDAKVPVRSAATKTTVKRKRG